MRNLLGSLWRGWQGIARAIGDFQARLLLTVFYFTIALPIGLLGRLVFDPLHLGHQPADSAWRKRHTRDTDLAAAQRQTWV